MPNRSEFDPKLGLLEKVKNGLQTPIVVIISFLIAYTSYFIISLLSTPESLTMGILLEILIPSFSIQSIFSVFLFIVLVILISLIFSDYVNRKRVETPSQIKIALLFVDGVFLLSLALIWFIIFFYGMVNGYVLVSNIDIPTTQKTIFVLLGPIGIASITVILFVGWNLFYRVSSSPEELMLQLQKIYGPRSDDVRRNLGKHFIAKVGIAMISSLLVVPLLFLYATWRRSGGLDQQEINQFFGFNLAIFLGSILLSVYLLYKSSWRFIIRSGRK